MRTRIQVAAILVAGLLATGLGRGVAPAARAADTASLRVVHAATGAPALDITLDGQPLAQQLAFSAITPVATVAASSHTLTATVSGQPQNTVFSTSLPLQGGTDTMVAIIGLWPTLTILPLSNSTPLPASGQAMVRLVNGAPWLQPMDVVRNGSAMMFSNVAYRTAADYVAIANGAYELEAREHGQTTDVVDDTGVPFANGEDVTLIVAGNGSDDNPVLMPVVTRASAATANVAGVPATGVHDGSSAAPGMLAALALLVLSVGVVCLRLGRTAEEGALGTTGRVE